jgi:hypothetical protein
LLPADEFLSTEVLATLSEGELIDFFRALGVLAGHRSKN